MLYVHSRNGPWITARLKVRVLGHTTVNLNWLYSMNKNSLLSLPLHTFHLEFEQTVVKWETDIHGENLQKLYSWWCWHPGCGGEHNNETTMSPPCSHPTLADFAQNWWFSRTKNVENVFTRPGAARCCAAVCCAGPTETLSAAWGPNIDWRRQHCTGGLKLYLKTSIHLELRGVGRCIDNNIETVPAISDFIISRERICCPRNWTPAKWKS